MKISVITPTHNSAATIVDTLEAVAGQSHPDVEHIVVDGASTDATLTLVEKYGKRVAKVISEPDRGIYDAMNKGIALATGCVVGFLNSDDVFAHDDVLREYANAMEGEETEACYGDLVYVSDANPNKVVRYWRSAPYRRGAYTKGWTPPHPTFYVRRSVYESYGAFDLRISLAADFEIMCRLMHVIGIRTRYLPGVKVKMRLGGATNVSLRNVVRANIEIIDAMRMHGVPVGYQYFLGKMRERLSQFVRSAVSTRSF